MDKEVINPADRVTAGAVFAPALLEGFKAPPLTYDMECVGPDERHREEYLSLLRDAQQAELVGRLLTATDLRRRANRLVRRQWREVFHNLVTTEGKNDILDKYFKGSSYTA